MQPAMLTRRLVLSAPLLALGARAAVAARPGFEAFLDGVAAEARDQGISDATLRQALRGLQPNARVLELDRAQPEFTQTWQHYRDTRLSGTRIAAGQAIYAQDRDLLDAVRTELRVDPAVIMGIWGLETNYGGFTGGFNVVQALATLAWDGRRASYFRPELLAALGILDNGDVSFPRMLGSYAGAMGQPQFMPTSFRRYAVDFDGDGKRDIWDDRSDVLASIANYLGKSGWRAGEPWGVAVSLPPSVGAADAGKPGRAAVSAWARRGVRLADGQRLPRGDLPAYLVLPAGEGGDAFLVYPNFAAIRRYNPSDFYALAVGLLGDRVAEA
jgi:membrane-bound lytic murein transglycosylase B